MNKANKATSATKVRKFVARTYSEALQSVKAALGTDAVILANRMVISEEHGSEPVVELTAAVGEEASSMVEDTLPMRNRRSREESLHSNSLPSSKKGWGGPDVLRPYYRCLTEEGVRDRLIDDIMQSVIHRVAQFGPRGLSRALDFLLIELMDRVVIYSERRKQSIQSACCLLGTSGVGKTTMLAKLAVISALQSSQRVAIVSLGNRAGAREALRLTTGIIDSPMLQAETPQALEKTIAQLSGYDRIFLDTPGINPFDASEVAKLAQMLAIIPGVELHLVLNATMRDSDLFRAIESFSTLGLNAIAFARLDESTSYGALLNVVDMAKLPLSYFGFGREIPSDLERASKERVLDLLLDLASQNMAGASG